MGIPVDMRLKDVFDIGIKMGQDSDIRNIDRPGTYSGIYADCWIIHGSRDKEINKAYIAVDAGVPEMLVVHELNKKRGKIDCMIMHHPTGAGSYNLTRVVEIQKYNWIRFGIKEASAEKVFREMVEEESIGLKAGNHLAVGNAAEMLDIPVICIHTAIDNIIQVFFEELLRTRDHRTVCDIFDIISSIPECRMASSNGDSPYVIGDGRSISGKIFVDMTGGMDPDPAIFKLLKKAGIDNLISMHYSK